MNNTITKEINLQTSEVVTFNNSYQQLDVKLILSEVFADESCNDINYGL